MGKFIKTSMLFILFFVNNSFANNTLKTAIEKEKILIGFYGRPNTKSLGILGQSSLDELVKKMHEKKLFYEKELGDKFEVQMAFHIIYGLATPDAGRRNDYMLRLSHKSLMNFINRAKKENFKVIIDLQMGTNSPSEAVKIVLEYLKYDKVHLAIDPEFKIPKHRRYPPGRYVGHIFAQDLNEVQRLVNDYIQENNLNKKELIVHMFHPRMLRKKDEVEKFNNVNLIYNIDGHGNPAVKIKIYNNLYTQEELDIAKSGFKIFYETDTKIMSPKEILGFEESFGRKIWEKPYYINYQ
ncbi:hypothetical protein [Arcobacter arenosus]|uniref:Uncharacterized protein n=1 Tax=Arcobacter arenosus TaxID=2576037 RepID=A0A5R8Y3I0_9BACT|nr:hypothetical protein [Arcobacter arenosus]TLP40626.1 hypothetical protein FDK22_01035 [Arcobacter arenosus]